MGSAKGKNLSTFYNINDNLYSTLIKKNPKSIDIFAKSRDIFAKFIFQIDICKTDKRMQN